MVCIIKVDADRISRIKKDICELVLIGENHLRSVLNPIIFLSAINWYL